VAPGEEADHGRVLDGVECWRQALRNTGSGHARRKIPKEVKDVPLRMAARLIIRLSPPQLAEQSKRSRRNIAVGRDRGPSAFPWASLLSGAKMIDESRGFPARVQSLTADTLRFPLPPDRSPFRLGRPTAGPGPRQDAQVIRDRPQADPPLHSAWPTIPTAPEPVAPLEDADATFAARAPAQRPAKPTLARRRVVS
jgi:hypothetical protein